MINLRFARETDVPTILSFIKELAVYEKLEKEVFATEELLRKNLFEKKLAEVIITEFQGKPVGYALFFHSFSTFLGKGGIYLEDLYVTPMYRNKGIGKLVLSFLAKLALERDCARLEWSCLDWNEPSIAFYKERGAIPMDGWSVYRVTGERLKTLSEEF